VSLALAIALQAAIDAAPDGATVSLAGRSYDGPVAIAHPIALVGPGAIRGTITVTAPDVTVAGVTVDGGSIQVERTQRVTLRGNIVRGAPAASLGLRADGIHLWETTDSLVEDNRVTGARDVVVWYSSRNRIVGNRVEHGRYGAHLMYSHDCLIADNRFTDDVVGVFVMYSHGVTVRGNTVARAGGSAGMGIGLKDSGNLVVDGNLFVDDTVGIYIDDSPIQNGEIDTFTGNRVVGCDAGVAFLAGTKRTWFRGNAFAANQRQVRVEGGGDALGVRWEENAFDDYAGYDLDGDGIGDVPYQLRSLASDLTDGHPDLRFFTGAPALALLDAVGSLAPLYPPRLILVDERPRLAR
jgi:nitrous oxidase accessory protein